MDATEAAGLSAKEKKAAYNRKYRQANAEKEKKAKRKYRQANAEKEKERKRKYQQENAEKVKEYYRKHRQANTEQQAAIKTMQMIQACAELAAYAQSK